MTYAPLGRSNENIKTYITFPNSGKREIPAEVRGRQENRGQQQTTRNTFPSGRRETVFGDDPESTISFDCRLVPSSVDHRYLAGLAGGNTTIQVEEVEEEIEISDTSGASSTVAIATDGVCTFAGSDHPAVGDVAPGMFIKVGGKNHEIVKIEPGSSGTASEFGTKISDNKVTCRKTLSAAVTAGTYSIVYPQAKTGDYGCKVQECPGIGSYTSESPGHRSGNIVLTPTGKLPTLTPVDLPSYA